MNVIRNYVVLSLVVTLFISFSCFKVESDVDGEYPEILVNQDNMYDTVSYLTSLDPARNYSNLDSLNNAADYISLSLMGSGYETVEQTFIVEGSEYKNIIAGYGSIDLPVLVVGAHYDVAYDQPGADDNASAIAGLLELARLLEEYKPDLDYRVEFVAYSLEEPPFFKTKSMGSYIHAKSLDDNNRNVIGMICMDMIGYFSDEPDSQTYPLSSMRKSYPSTANFIAVLSDNKSIDLIKHVYGHMANADIPVETMKAPSFLPFIRLSDQINYWEFDYEAVMITDTARFRNPNYHEVTDTIDTLNFEKMVEVVRGLYFSIINPLE